MRFFVNELTNYPRPLKMFYFGQCFRYERPQSGRYREFFQFGAELIGNPGPESDAEVIALSASIIRSIGLRDYRIRIGHIGVLKDLLASSGISGEAAQPILQKLDKKEFEEARTSMVQAGMDRSSIEKVIDITGTIGSIEVLEKVDGDAKEHLHEIFDILSDYGFK